MSIGNPPNKPSDAGRTHGHSRGMAVLIAIGVVSVLLAAGFGLVASIVVSLSLPLAGAGTIVGGEVAGALNPGQDGGEGAREVVHGGGCADGSGAHCRDHG